MKKDASREPKKRKHTLSIIECVCDVRFDNLSLISLRQIILDFKMTAVKINNLVI